MIDGSPKENRFEELNAETMHWVSNFLAKPHPDLGRSGPVCPFIPPALEKNRLIIVVSEVEPSKENFRSTLHEHKEAFLREQDVNNPDTIYNCRLVVCDCSTEQHAQWMDEVQSEMKVPFMNDGLMVGQFHPYSTVQGLHNPDFHPFAAPVFCFAIRHMIEGDRVFVTQNLAANRIIDASIAYQKRFGATL